MKRFVTMVAATMIGVTAAYAEPKVEPADRAALIPVELLMEGLQTMSLCIGINSAGITALSIVDREQQKEPSYNKKQVDDSITYDSLELLMNLSGYGDIGAGIADTLEKHHKYSERQIGTIIKEAVEVNNKNTLKKLSDVIEYKDFKEKFEPILELCNNAVTELEAKIEVVLKVK